MDLNKVTLMILILISLSSYSFANKINPMNDYISDDVFREAEKKFSEDKNFFKSEKTVKLGTGGSVKSTNSLSNVFIKVDTIIRKDRKWGCIVFYKERDAYTDITTKRKVILGNTIVKISGIKYFLRPYETGVEIREIVSGNTIHLKVQEGR